MGQKEGNGFHVTMGAHDGAEICESIGVFMLSLIEKKKKKKKKILKIFDYIGTMV